MSPKLLFLCLAALLPLIVFGGSPACNPPVGMDQGQAVRTLGSKRTTKTTKAPTTTTKAPTKSAKTAATTTTKAPTTTTTTKALTTKIPVIIPTSLSKECLNQLNTIGGECCFRCTDPYYYDTKGVKKPICTCSNPNSYHFSRKGDCYPTGKTIDFRYYGDLSKLPGQMDVASVTSGAEAGMIAYNTCVNYVGCNCVNPTTVPQPVYAYDPRPPVGSIGARLPIYNEAIGILNDAIAKQVLLNDGVAIFNTAFKSVNKFYFFNDAGNLVASRNAETTQVVELLNAIKAVQTYIDNDFMVTPARNDLYRKLFDKFFAGELGFLYQFYTNALDVYKPKLTAEVVASVQADLDTVKQYLTYYI